MRVFNSYGYRELRELLADEALLLEKVNRSLDVFEWFTVDHREMI